MARKDTYGKADDLHFFKVNGTESSSNSEYQHIPASKIKMSPFNEGMPMDEKMISEYADSMRKTGLLQPISVYDLNDGTFEIISGHQRFVAWCTILNHPTIPAVVRPNEPDVRKRFAAHTDANTKNRKLDGRFWCSRITQAKKVLSKTGSIGSRADEIKQLTEMLGIGQAQIYRLESFANLSPALQECEAKGLLSVKKSLLAKGLELNQQEMVAEEVKNFAVHKAATEEEDVSELTEQEFISILNNVKKGTAKPTKSHLSYADKTAQAGKSFLKMLSKSKTTQEKQAALEAINELRKKLDEAENKIRSTT